MGIRLTGMEPSHDYYWSKATQAEQAQFWDKCGEIGVEVKRKSLLRGLDRDDTRMLPRLRPRRDRANGPPLSPHRPKSRTVRNLDYTAGHRGVSLHWRGGWQQVLGYHAAGIPSGSGLRVRDVLGVSLSDRLTIQRRARTYWTQRIRPDVVKRELEQPRPKPPAVAAAAKVRKQKLTRREKNLIRAQPYLAPYFGQ